jgi:hypothetical protein
MWRGELSLNEHGVAVPVMKNLIVHNQAEQSHAEREGFLIDERAAISNVMSQKLKYLEQSERDRQAADRRLRDHLEQAVSQLLKDRHTPQTVTSVSEALTAVQSVSVTESVTATPPPTKRTHGTGAVFPGPRPQKWDDVCIHFASEELVQITVAGHRYPPCKYTSMGLANHRTGRPNQVWKTLRQLAESDGRIKPRGKHFSARLKMQIATTRQFLCGYFQLSDDPLPFRKAEHGYRARFRLSQAVSYEH